MNTKLLVKKITSAKNGRTYTMLVLDLGYIQKTLSFDPELCAQCLDMRASEFCNLPLGEHIILEKGVS